MILYPPAKINLGLHILKKRSDGYHQIETIMAAIPFYDILEITPWAQDQFIQTGIEVPDQGELNLCQKALILLRNYVDIPPVRIHLRKQIPVGAGLGGGSSDASYTLLGLNTMFELGFTLNELEVFAAQLGSDCPFFIRGGLQLASGRGELLSQLPKLNFKVQLALLNPGVHVSTAKAYSQVKPNSERSSLKEWVEGKEFSGLQNDFESSVFGQFPIIEEIKTKLSDHGAFYSAMSGSGSSVFGLFDLNQEIDLPNELEKFVLYRGKFEF